MKANGGKLTAMLMVVACGIYLAGCAGHFGTGDEQWYSAHPLSKTELMAKWGTPNRVVSHEDGMQELIYLRAIEPSAGGKSALVYQIKNDMVVKTYWKQM